MARWSDVPINPTLKPAPFDGLFINKTPWVVGLVACVIGGIWLGSVGPFGFPGAFLFYGATVVLFFVGIALLEKEKQPNKQDLYWVGGPQDRIPEWDVDIDVVQQGVTTGRDTGKLWFQDGAANFVGRATSFVLTKRQLADIAPLTRYQQPQTPFERAIVVRLAALNGTSTWSVNFAARSGGSNDRLFQELRWHLDADSPIGIGQFPPTGLGPGHMTRRLLWLLALPYAFVWLMAVWFLLGFVVYLLKTYGPGVGLPLWIPEHSAGLLPVSVMVVVQSLRQRSYLGQLRRAWRNLDPVIRRASASNELPLP